MSKRDEVFPSKYWKASDLKDGPRTFKIERAPIETLKSPDGKEERKTVLYFEGAQKLLPLNRTNWDSTADICGDDTDDWPGHKIELYGSTTSLKGKTVACVRVRAPTQRQLPMQRPKAAKTTKANTKAHPTVAEEMDDEIPFEP